MLIFLALLLLQLLHVLLSIQTCSSLHILKKLLGVWSNLCSKSCSNEALYFFPVFTEKFETYRERWFLGNDGSYLKRIFASLLWSIDLIGQVFAGPFYPVYFRSFQNFQDQLMRLSRCLGILSSALGDLATLTKLEAGGADSIPTMAEPVAKGTTIVASRVELVVVWVRMQFVGVDQPGTSAMVCKRKPATVSRSRQWQQVLWLGRWLEGFCMPNW